MTSPAHDEEHATTLEYAGNGAAKWAHPFWLALDFLLPRKESQCPSDWPWARAGNWFVMVGLLLGIVYAGAFRAAWRVFGEYQYIRFVPVAVVLAIDIAWGGYYPLRAAVKVIVRRERNDDPFAAMVALLVFVILKYAMLLSLPLGEAEGADWRARLGWFYPKPIYRPLILMPLWGRWAATLALCIGRAHREEQPHFLRMTSGVRLSVITAGWTLIAALTVLYASSRAGDLARGIIVGLGVLVVTYLVSFVLAQREQGQTRWTVLATCLAAEMAFLVFYLPVVSDVFRY